MLSQPPRALVLPAMLLGTSLAFGGSEPLPATGEARLPSTEQVSPASAPHALGIPEPATVLLSCLGILGLLLRRRA